jgi:hypothetical protein
VRGDRAQKRLALVPAAMSPLSSSSTRRPRIAASRATPHPFTPAPTTIKSKVAPEMSHPTVLISRKI